MTTSRRTRWTLRCVDLLLRASYVITTVDRASGEILLNITGAKSVRLTIRDSSRLRGHLEEAEAVAETMTR